MIINIRVLTMLHQANFDCFHSFRPRLFEASSDKTARETWITVTLDLVELLEILLNAADEMLWLMQ